MNAPQLIREYPDIVKTLVERRLELGMSAMELDARAGWQEGYTSKLENWDKNYGRSFGRVLLPVWLEALDMSMIFVRHDRKASRGL
jgi:predicted transcriptional regulator